MKTESSAFEKTARQKIAELRARPVLTTANRDLLERLDTFPVMRTEVWQKLPADAPAEMGSDIISWTYGAANVAVTYAPPPPRQRNKLLHHITKYPPVLTAESAFLHADFLREAMSATQVDATERWQHLWQGDTAISFERAYLLVKDISDFYRALHAETVALLKATIRGRRRSRGRAAHSPKKSP